MVGVAGGIPSDDVPVLQLKCFVLFKKDAICRSDLRCDAIFLEENNESYVLLFIGGGVLAFAR